LQFAFRRNASTGRGLPPEPRGEGDAEKWQTLRAVKATTKNNVPEWGDGPTGEELDCSGEKKQKGGRRKKQSQRGDLTVKSRD